jgi:hypothetical protein
MLRSTRVIPICRVCTFLFFSPEKSSFTPLVRQELKIQTSFEGMNALYGLVGSENKKSIGMYSEVAPFIHRLV